MMVLVISALWVFVYKYINPPISGMMLYKIVTIEDYEYEYDWVDLDSVNYSIPLAFIAAEDQLFLKHNGFDIEAIGKAIKHNRKSDRKRGASTISQQVAKNVFLIPKKTLFRKGLEAYFTVLIELIWDKRRIMEIYLNVVELDEGLFGVKSASKRIFDNHAFNVSKSQAALIATALPNPILFQLKKPSEYMNKRKLWVLRQMNNLGGESLLKEWYE